MIELMVVVAIIGILAAIAIPAYQDYTTRARVAEGLGVASGVKTAVSETRQATGSLPDSNVAAGVPMATSITGNSVTRVDVNSGGQIIITYSGGEIDGQTLALTPSFGSGSLVWQCSSTTIAPRFLPAACRP